MTDETLIDIEVLSPDQPIKAYSPIVDAIEKLATTHGKTIFDVTTTAGMEAAKKARAEIREPRYRIEHIRKALKAPALAYSKRIDDEAKAYTARLLELEQPIDEQIKAEELRKQREKEEAERKAQQRRDEIAQALAEIQFLPVYAKDKTSVQVEMIIMDLRDKQLTEEEFGDRLGEAGFAKEAALRGLGAILAEKVEAEQRAIEEERQRAEREAEQKAEAERLANEREELRKQAEELARQREEIQRAKAEQAAPVAVVSELPAPEPEPVAIVPAVVSYGSGSIDDDPFAKADDTTPFPQAKPVNPMPSRDEVIRYIADVYAVSATEAEAWLVTLFRGD